MNVWDDLHQNITKRSKEWLSWAKQHAQEIGDAGVRHIERQDLLGERKHLVQRLGDDVANRFLVEGKKTIRNDSPEVKETVERIRLIDERLLLLAKFDSEEDAESSDEKFTGDS